MIRSASDIVLKLSFYLALEAVGSRGILTDER